MKCPICGLESDLNPFSICQGCGNILTPGDGKKWFFLV